MALCNPYLNGSKSCLNYAFFCNELRIEIIALFPSSARTLQPCDVDVFWQYSSRVESEVRDEEYPGKALSKLTLAPMLESLYTSRPRQDKTIRRDRDDTGETRLTSDLKSRLVLQYHYLN